MSDADCFAGAAQLAEVLDRECDHLRRELAEARAAHAESERIIDALAHTIDVTSLNTESRTSALREQIRSLEEVVAIEAACARRAERQRDNLIAAGNRLLNKRGNEAWDELLLAIDGAKP